jgi:hypothetical protein
VEVYGGTPLEARLAAEGRLLGDYMGYTYRIADHRAQRAYELFRSVFWPRNFDFDGTHFGSMRLDYELHLLRHFWPDRATPDIWRRGKGLLHELNRHSAALMDRILDFAASDAVDDEDVAEALRRDLELERCAVDESIRRRSRELLDLIEALAERVPDRRLFLQAAVGTAAAAALAVAPGCRSRETHMCEAPPPPPPPPDYTHMCEAPPPPEPDPELQGAELEALRAAAQARIDGTIWPQLHSRFTDADTLEISVLVEPAGRVLVCSPVGSGSPELVAAVCQDLQQTPLQVPELQQLGQAPPRWRATLPLVWRGTVRRTKRQPDVGVEGVPIDHTHMCEAPPPPDLEGTSLRRQ